MAKSLKYDSSNIETRGGLAGIRTSASMYLGSVDAAGVFLTVRELLDNAVDEHLAGRNDAVWMHIDKDGSYWVLDRGLGVPQGVKEIHMHVNGKSIVNKVPTMQAVFGELHTSGKYRSEAYKVSIGSHGIGSKGTNATALYFNVSTFYKKHWYSIGFEKGVLTSAVAKMKKAPVGPDGKALRKGTCIHFKPDPTIFSVKAFPPLMFHEWAEIMSYLNPGFAIVVTSTKGRKVYLSRKGPLDYLEKRVRQLKTVQIDKQVFDYRSDMADIVVAFTNYDGSDVRGFTNGLSNLDGGTHVQSLYNGMYKGLLLALARHRKRMSFSISDFREGLVGFVNAKLHKAQFTGQNKDKLTDARLGAAFTATIVEAATKFFTKNKTLTFKIADRASKINALKVSFSKSKKLVNALNSIKKSGIPVNKYATYDRKVPVNERELYIVEGDSASGGLKEARFKNQAVLAMRGKIMNAQKSGTKVFESEEVTYILSAIGFDPKAKDPYANLKVGKIICFSDADSDGLHINTLELTLFYKYMPRLFEMGMIYVADTPEFYAQKGTDVYYGATLSEVKKKLKAAKLPASTTINHIKGWGEIDHQLLRILAADPKTRTLIQMKSITSDDSDFEKLMNDDVDFRKKLLGIQ